MAKILFFATLKERAGTRQLDLPLAPETRIRDLKALLANRLPALRPNLASALIAVNHEYAFDDDVIPTDAEIAIFPPVSGG
jgi:molybdopterin converting factor subunit 1